MTRLTCQRHFIEFISSETPESQSKSQGTHRSRLSGSRVLNLLPAQSELSASHSKILSLAILRMGIDPFRLMEGISYSTTAELQL